MDENPVELFNMYVAHVGINTSTPEDAEDVAAKFCTLLGVPRVQTHPISVFAGTLIEVMNNGGRGEKGHIGLHVDNLPAAIEWFEARGMELNHDAVAYLPDGSLELMYFKDEIAGFAIHLTVDE